MSLFEDSEYEWRETYFLFFTPDHHPSAAEVIELFAPMKNRLQIREASDDENGKLEAMTIIASADSAGVDVSFVESEEVIEQRQELVAENKNTAWSAEDKPKWKQLLASDCRFDVFHFQHVSAGGEDGDLDPGAILSVLSVLAKLCRGVAYDPQSGTFV
jgi:hypothetical protein